VEKQNSYLLFAAVAVNWRICTKVIAILVYTNDIKIGLKITNIESQITEKKTRGHWLRDVVAVE